MIAAMLAWVQLVIVLLFVLFTGYEGLLLLLLLRGMSFREAGFARGYRSWAMTLLWCTPLLIVIVVFLLSGGTRLSTLGLELLHTVCATGFSKSSSSGASSWPY